MFHDGKHKTLLSYFQAGCMAYRYKNPISHPQPLIWNLLLTEGATPFHAAVKEHSELQLVCTHAARFSQGGVKHWLHLIILAAQPPLPELPNSNQPTKAKNQMHIKCMAVTRRILDTQPPLLTADKQLKCYQRDNYLYSHGYWMPNIFIRPKPTLISNFISSHSSFHIPFHLPLPELIIPGERCNLY